MKTLNYEQAVELVEKQIAKEGPDFVYRQKEEGAGCTYMYEGKPDCLIGRVLYDVLGYVDPTWDTSLPGGQSVNMVLIKLETDKVLMTTNKSAVYLRTVQTLQDRGTSWGEANTQAQTFSNSRINGFRE